MNHINSLWYSRLVPGRTIRILSVDGGGIRGYLAALILEEIEKKRTEIGRKKPFCRCFDMMAGTSTGSLISLGLAVPQSRKLPTDSPEESSKKTPLMPRLINILSTNAHPKYNAAEIARLYREKGTEIFPRYIFKQLNTVRQAFVEKYDAGNFDRVLEDIFGDLTLRDALGRVLITSYDTLSARPIIMKNLPGEENFYMKDAARGSSAAPSYFSPVEVTGLDSNAPFCLVDGGVFANNPAMCAYVEARRLFPLARKFFILSLGSGQLEQRLSYKQVKSWGYVEWVLPQNNVPLFGMMSTGQNKCVDYQLNHLPGVTYIRFNPLLNGCSEEMDDAGAKNMECLEAVAKRTIEGNRRLIDLIARFL
ncbi:patatin-like phospholipase family protein [Sediminispirochaeta smaragdinae]|uniref:Patatin n=1 Tax=Sediminispirochaeta smaragdinae (strain DSM 11293 / JCM 15392 / SEBR 4228) TaxID=573413 RepID=E1R6R9_SEDSS|nr:patatin-like phospholipase family protein [Sediminispirochaeta smaragdinae]ADK79201.1 Patatin [Sediminispirochaeta smaragdinae DSM 11293]